MNDDDHIISAASLCVTKDKVPGEMRNSKSGRCWESLLLFPTKDRNGVRSSNNEWDMVKHYYSEKEAHILSVIFLTICSTN